MLSAEELHRRGVRAYNRGRHAEAEGLFARARAGLEPGDLLARIQLSEAYLLAERGDPRAALDLCDVALGHPGMDDATRGAVHGQVGLLQMLRGESTAALAAFDLAVPLLTDPLRLGNTFLNRGNVHLQRDEPRAAAADFEAADRYYSSDGDEYSAAKAQHNLGYALLLEGDLIGALHHLDEAYATFVTEGPVMTAMADQDRAEALLAAGLVDEALEALARSATAYGRRRLPQRQAEAELVIARTTLAVDPRRAAQVARRARDRFERTDSPAWRDRADAVVVAAEVELGRSGPRLLAYGDELAGRLDRHGLRAAATSTGLHLARALVRRGDLDGATARLRRHRARSDSPLDVRLLDHDTRAALHAARGRRSRALDELREGLGDLHGWQSSFGSLDLQTNVVGHGVRLAAQGLRLAAASSTPEVLLEWSERARMLASRVQPVRAPQDEQTLADLAELRAGPGPEREAVLRRTVRERAWQVQGSGRIDDPVGPEELRAALEDDAALVAHVVTDAEVVAVVVTRDAVVRRPLGDRAALDGLVSGLAADLDVAGADLPDPIARGVRAQLDRRLGRLAERLVAPLLDDLGDRRLVLTPSGLLAGVPWPLLDGLRGRPVTVARSATAWVAGRADAADVGQRAGFVAGPGPARAEAEVAAAAAEWPGAVVLTGSGATADAVTRLAPEVDVLHVAAHGRHAADSPLFSGLELVDGSWFGYDVDLLPRVPGVVLLSACEVGRSSVRHRDELIGLTTAWLHAGARWVVASPAAVADDAAHAALLKVHAGLRRGLTPPEAIAAVERPSGAAPAPFVCFG